MTIPKINNGLTAAEYHAYSGLSKTQLGYLQRSPLHLRNYLDTPRTKATEDQIIGTAVHTAALESELFNDQYVIAPVCDRRTKEGKAVYAQFVTENFGKTALDAEDYHNVLAIAGAIRSAPALAQFGITTEGLRGVAEASVFGVDFGTNLGIKARLDYYDPETNTIIDIKTTKTSDFRSFRREIFKWGYGLQAVHYRDIVQQITGKPARFIFAAVEKESPYAVQLFELDEASYQALTDERAELFRQWSKALQTNTFKGYSTDIASVSLV